MAEQNPRPASGDNAKIQAFIAAIKAAIAAARLEVRSFGDNQVDLADANGRVATVNVLTLWKVVHVHDPSEWHDRLIVELDRIGPAALDRAEAVLATGLTGNAGALVPVLKPSESVKDSGMVFLPLVRDDPVYKLAEDVVAANKELGVKVEGVTDGRTDPYLTLGIDTPKNTIYITHEMLVQELQPAQALLTRALDNLREQTTGEWFEVVDEAADLRWVTTGDGYGASRALILDWLLPKEADGGWFVAPVGRDNLYFMPATAQALNDSLGGFARVARDEYQETLGPVSNQIYWVHQHRWYRCPVLVFGGKTVVMQPEAMSQQMGIGHEGASVPTRVSRRKPGKPKP